MAERFTQQANSALSQPYSSSSAVITGQVPAIQKLYDSLLTGLTNQGTASTNEIVNSAEQRGVGRASLGADTSAMLGQTIGQQGAVLGAQKAGDISANRVAGGELGVNKVNDISALASVLQEQDLANQQFQLDKTTQDRDQQLRIQQAQQQAARAAASAKQSEGWPDDIAQNTIGANLLAEAGTDGRVNPGDYNAALDAWVAVGGSPETFHIKYEGFVNKSHKDDYYKPITATTLRSVPNIDGGYSNKTLADRMAGLTGRARPVTNSTSTRQARY